MLIVACAAFVLLKYKPMVIDTVCAAFDCSTSVGNGVDSDVLVNFACSDVEEALKRISGITLHESMVVTANIHARV